jgi:hypothetical protein
VPAYRTDNILCRPLPGRYLPHLVSGVVALEVSYYYNPNDYLFFSKEKRILEAPFRLDANLRHFA